MPLRPVATTQTYAPIPVRFDGKLLGTVAWFLAPAMVAFAQGITSSGLAGFVRDTQGNPTAGATITIVHQPSGTHASTLTRASGQYDLSGLRVGGPYTVTVNAADFPAETRDDLYLELGESATLDFTLGASEVVKMTAFTVQEARETICSSAKIGTGTNIK